MTLESAIRLRAGSLSSLRSPASVPRSLYPAESVLRRLGVRRSCADGAPAAEAAK